MKKVALAALAALMLGVAAPGARADGPSPRLGRILGQVPSLLGGVPLPSGVGQLTYHGGPVMHTNRVYAIYWVPPGYTVSSDYRSLIDRYFGDVAADSGKQTNVYWSDTQYTDSSGNAAYSSSFGGSVLDTNALPASGCTDSDTSVCLSDAQVQAEIQRVKTAQGWSGGPSTEFFLLTAKGIGSCADATDCAFTQYCAYHSWFGSGSSVSLYANMPYADTVPSACDASSHPNGSEADPELSVVSHEHNETITDEQGNAWYDLSGYENGDKCAWDFGTAIGSTSSGAYNQLIDGHPYEVQQEYSNASSGCVLSGT